VTTAYTPPYTPPSLGDIVYLASALIRVRVGALTTNYDTPNQYTAELKVMGDQGDMNLDAIRGATGPVGQQTFAFRRQDDADVNSSADLPTNLTDSPEDIGKYWLIDTVDQGVVTKETAWTWYGTTEKWRTFMMGTFGPPGPMPDITVGVQNIDPSADAYVDGGGSTVEPTWELYLPQPAGVPGRVSPMYLFPDVDESTAPSQYDLLAYSGKDNSEGQPIWHPFSIQSLLPQPWSMPEGSFQAYSGVSQRALIGSFAVPPQPFAWTPVVWGHLGGTTLSAAGALNAIQNVLVSAFGGTFALIVNGTPTAAIPYNASPATIESAIQAVTGAGNAAVTAAEQAFSHLVEFVGSLAGTAVPTMTADISNLLGVGASVVIGVVQAGGELGTLVTEMLSGDPLRIGCQVLLGDSVATFEGGGGIQIARGLGSTLGRVFIVPHYSNSANLNQALTPINNYAVVPANHTGNQGTVYINLWNDGMLGFYDFSPTNAQIYIQATPIEIAQQLASPTPAHLYPQFLGGGSLSATAT
jgi:hypothetical protein